MKKNAVITGASGAIGAAVARALAAEYRIAAHCFTARESAEELVRELERAGCEAFAFAADLARADGAPMLICETEARFGAVDLLVNCAGTGWSGLITDMTDADYDRVFDVNMRGTFHTCRAVLPGMIRRQSGAIINLSSIWGLTGASCEAVYSAAKAAVVGFTKALAKEVGPSGIRVNCVAPGFIDTPMNAALTEREREDFVAGTPLGRTGTPEDVAAAVCYLARDGFMTGQVLSPNGGAVI